MAVAQIINDETRKIYRNLIPATSASLLDEITVASSQATQQTKDLADYVCSGVNDQEQIQQAIDDAHNAGGGTVKLSDGTFFVETQSQQYQSTDCCIFLREHVALVGEGRATTKIKKTDAGIGFALIWCYLQGTGMSVLDLDLDMDNKQNINVCLRAIHTSDSRFANIAFTEANTGFTYIEPQNCIAQDLFFVDCTDCLELDNNDDTLHPYIANIYVNDGLQPLPQFTFRTNTAVKLEGHNWTVSNVIMRVCDDKAIHFAECSNCVVSGVDGAVLQNAFYFESNAEECRAEHVSVLENYNSPVCVLQGTQNILEGWTVTEAGWDTNVQAVQPNSEKTSPFIVTGNGHRIIDLEFNEIEFTYSFDSVRAGIIEANNCDDLVLNELILNGNSQGKFNPDDEIGYGININNSTGIRCEDNNIDKTEGFGYFLDGVTSTDDIKSYVVGGAVTNTRWGFYTQNGCSRIDIQDITFYRCESSAIQLGASNPGVYNTLSGIKCYDTGGGGSTGGEPAVIKVFQKNDTISDVRIYNDQHGYFNNKSTGLFINNSHTHVSRCYVDGNVSGSLSIDVDSEDEKALNRGIFIAGPPSNKDFTLTNCYVYNCLRAGIQIGSSTSNCTIQGGEIKNTGNNSTPQQDAYNLQMADSNVVQANGIKHLKVLGVTAVAGLNTTANYKKYGDFGNHITFKDNTGLPNDTSDYREQLKHGLNAYYSFDGSNFLGDKFGIHDASQSLGGSIVQGSSNGIMGDCAVLNGTFGDYIQATADAFNFGGSAFTWQIWLYVANMTNQKVSLVEARGGGSSQNGIGISFDEANQRVGMFTIENNNTAVEVFGSSTIEASTWYHVVMKRDENDNYALYLNGQLEAEDLDSNATLSRASDLTGDSSVMNSPTFSGGLDGRLDEVACYFRDLAPHHLDQLYAQGNGNQSMLEYKWHDQPAQSDVHMNGHKITNVGAPASAQDATSKRYVDSLAGTPPLKDQIRAYYSFDGDYKDSTTNNYDGTPNGTTFNNSTAVINQSLEFTSNSDVVSVGDAFGFQSGDFTISVWVYPNVASDPRSGILALPGSNNRFSLEYGDNGNNGFRIWTYTTSATALVTPNNYPPGQWYHLVVTRTGSVGQIWINGQLSIQGSVESGDIANPSNTSTFGVPGKSLDGFIDEVGAWTRVLSQEEILHLYNNGDGTQYLSTYDWYAVKQSNHINMDGHRVSHLGEALQGSDAVDKAYVDRRAPMFQLYQGARGYWALDGDYTDSINGYHGTEQGGGSLSFSSTAKLGNNSNSVEFSGADNDYVALSSGAFDFGTTDFTWQVWVQHKAFQTKGGIYLISLKDANNWMLIGNDDAGSSSTKFMFKYSNGGTVSKETGSISANTNQWYHIILTRTGNTIKLYVDGVEDISATITLNNYTGNNSNIGIDADKNMSGYIDEVGAWDRALTENEIKYLYHEGQGTNDFVGYDYTFNYPVDMNQHRIRNVGAPSAASDATTKEYVESVAGVPPLTDQLRAYYAFDGDYKDSTTNNHDGTPFGTTAITTGSQGFIGEAVEINSGTTDYVNFGDAWDVQSSDFTMSYWFYPKSNSLPTNPIVFNNSNHSTRFGSEWKQNRFTFYTEQSSTVQNIATPAKAGFSNLNEWYHVVFQREGSTGRIYVNGNLERTGAVNSGVISVGGQSTIARSDTVDRDNFLVDEIGAWFRVLSTREILHLYNHGSGNQYLSTYNWYAVTQHSHVDMNGYRVTQLGEALDKTDAVSKQYVDSRETMHQLYKDARAYYDFEGDYKDSIGKYGGTNNGASFSPGLLGQCADLSGSDTVDLGNAGDIQSGDFTMSLWYYPKQLTDNNYPIWVGGGLAPRWGILHSETSGNIKFYLEDNTTDYGASATDTGDVLNRWYHLVVQREGTTGRIYVNGTKRDTSTVTGNSISSGSSIIGRSGFSNDLKVDELGIWDRALTENEIKYLYHEGQGTNDFISYDYTFNYPIDMNSHKITNVGAPVSDQDATSKRYVDSLAGTPPLKDQIRAYYSFDGDYKDSTGNYDGTNKGTSFTSGIIGQAIDTTGGKNYVDVSGLFNWGTSDFSVGAWVYPTVSSGKHYIAGNFDSVNGNNVIFVWNPNGSYGFRLRTDEGGRSDVTTNGSYAPTQWHHVVFTRTGSTGEVYVNGQLDKTGTVNSGNLSGDASRSAIGVSDPVNANTDWWEGHIDEFGVWDRVLSSQEILHLYNNGNGTQYLSTYDWYAVTQQNHVDMNGYRVSNLGEALQSGDAVDKAYVDSRAPMSQLHQGARAYYTLDGDYTDSINGYDGTNNGTSLVSGKINQGVDIKNGNYVDISPSLNFGTGDFSVGFWVYPRHDTVQGRRLTTMESTSRTAIQYSVGQSQAFRFRTYDGNSSSAMITNPDYPPYFWYYVVVTRTGGTAEIWVNGQLAQTGTVLSTDITENTTNVIGDSKDSAEDSIIDEFGAWDRVLTANEIKYLYHEGQGTQEFVSYDYTFNYDVDMNQNQILNLASANTTNLTITDNAVNYYAPPNNYGVAMLQASGDIVMIMYDVANNNTQFVHQFGSLFANEGGTNLTGIDGTDGKISISSNSGQIHVENRSGSQITIRLLVIF